MARVSARLGRSLGVPGLVCLGLAACGSGSGSTSTVPPTFAHADVATPTPTSAPSGTSWAIGPIDAAFDPACYCTDYQVTVFVTTVSAPGSWNVTWTLQLMLVDRAGMPDPSVPGSGAAVDPGCDNKGAGTVHPVTEALSFAANGEKDTSSFTWYHPDPATPAGGYPAGTYHCNHALQGPVGHEGVITVTVTHGALVCTAKYWGTKSGQSDFPSQPGSPACSKT